MVPRRVILPRTDFMETENFTNGLCHILAKRTKIHSFQEVQVLDGPPRWGTQMVQFWVGPPLRVANLGGIFQVVNTRV